MKVLALGGPGFVGSAACRELMRRGFETIAASRTAKPYGTFTSHVAFDRTDETQLRHVLDEVRPDVLLDLACYQPAEVDAVIRHFRGGRYVFISTGVYPDDMGPRPAVEADFVPLEGQVPTVEQEYRQGKRWCETVLARSPDFNSVVIRPPAVLGAGDHTLRVAAYLERVADGGPLLVPVESHRQQLGIVWTRDLGYACALACDLRKPAAGPYNVAFEGVSLAAMIEAMASIMERPLRLLPVPFAELPPGASPYGPDPRRSAGHATARIRTELGWEASALEDALAEVLAWFRAEQPSHPGYANRAAEIAGIDTPSRLMKNRP